MSTTTTVGRGKIEVFTFQGKPILLDESQEIQRGGEGRILPIGTAGEHVAKLYLKGVNSIHPDKFVYLEKLNGSLFVKPLDLLYDSKKQVKGFMMEYVGKNYTPLDQVFVRGFCLSNNIDHKIKETITRGLISGVKQAHNLNIVIGDLSGFNILVDTKGNLKFIDVDSYQTPGFTHSGKLLNDIRDHLYNTVSEQADYFSLAVVIFNLLTHIHPFKGTHRVLRDDLVTRMIKKIPVFARDLDLRIPKFYQPIQDANLQQQFERIFLRGERFLVSLDNVQTLHTSVLTPVKKTTITKGELLIHEILITNAEIENVNFSDALGVIRTKNNYTIIAADIPGQVSIKQIIDRVEYDNVFVGNINVVGKKGNNLWLLQGNVKSLITNFVIPSNSLLHQIDNVLVVVSKDTMFWVYLDEITAGNIKLNKTFVFGPGFRLRSSLIQNAGGSEYIFYKTGSQLSTVLTSCSLQDIYQRKNVGIVKYIENNKVKLHYFNLSGLNLQVQDREQLDYMYRFAYKSTSPTSGLIFQPLDDAIAVRRVEDFQEISRINCDLVSEASDLQYCNAGLVVWDENHCYLLNKNQ